MTTFIAIAIGTGYFGGVFLAFYLSKLLLHGITINFAVNERQKQLIRGIGIALGVVALVPAIFLATVVGGNLGGSYGGIMSESIGLGEVGIPVGLATGLVLVIAVTVTAILFVGACLGLLVARVFYRGSAT